MTSSAGDDRSFTFVFGPPGTATIREIVAYNAEKYARLEVDEWLWFVQALFDDWEDPLQHPNLLAKIADQHYGDGTEIVIRFQSQRIDSTQLPGIELSLTIRKDDPSLWSSMRPISSLGCLRG